MNRSQNAPQNSDRLEKQEFKNLENTLTEVRKYLNIFFVQLNDDEKTFLQTTLQNADNFRDSPVSSIKTFTFPETQNLNSALWNAGINFLAQNFEENFGIIKISQHKNADEMKNFMKSFLESMGKILTKSHQITEKISQKTEEILQNES